jgi:hypothetical protein
MTTDDTMIKTIEEIIQSLTIIMNNNDRATIRAIQPELCSYKELIETIDLIN